MLLPEYGKIHIETSFVCRKEINKKSLKFKLLTGKKIGLKNKKN